MEVLIKPCQLITYSDSGKFEVVEETVVKLSKVKGAIHSLGIIGKYRSGKSFLLNKIMGIDSDSGFALGSSINSKTKGIWISCIDYNMRTIVLMDSEGLFDPGRGVNFDNKIICLLLLLSSMIILNTKGTIDRNSLTQIEFVSSLASNIKVFSNKKTSVNDFSDIFPKFCWVVRDFFLQLKNNQGEWLNDDEYLEEMTKFEQKELNSLNEGTAKTARTKKFFRKVFKDRHCITLPQPITDSKRLRTIENLDDDELSAEFMKKFGFLKQFIISNISKKNSFGTHWTGAIFGRMAGQLVSQMNSARFISVDTSFSSVLEFHNGDVAKECVEMYVMRMEEVVGKRLPVAEGELVKEHEARMAEVEKRFVSKIIFDEEEKKKKLVDALRAKIAVMDSEGEEKKCVAGIFYEEFLLKNQKETKRKCQSFLENGWENVNVNVKQFVSSENGMQMFEDARRNIEKAFYAEFGDLPQADVIFVDFKNEKRDLENQIRFMISFGNKERKKEMELEHLLQEKEEELEKLQKKKETDNTKPKIMDFDCKVVDLPKMDLFGKCDPYFVLYNSKNEELYRSNIVKDVFSAEYKGCRVRFIDPEEEVKVVMFDWNRLKKDDTIGDFSAKIKHVIERGDCEYEVHSKYAKKKKCMFGFERVDVFQLSK